MAPARKQKIVVVGGGAGGAAAAAKARRMFADARITILDKSAHVAFGACELPMYLAGHMSAIDDLQLFSAAELAKVKDVDVLTGATVVEVTTAGKFVTYVKDGNREKLPYDKLIWAAGALARRPEWLPVSLDNAFAFKQPEEVEQLVQQIRSRKGQNCIVLGTGYVGLEVASALHESGRSVALVNRGAWPLPGYGKLVRHFLPDFLQQQGVLYYPNAEVAGIRENNNRFQALRLKQQTLTADYLMTAIGVRPNTLVLKQAGLQINADETVVTDRYLKTSHNDILAIGDAIQSFAFPNGKRCYFPLAQTAYRSGHIAAENLFRPTRKMPDSLGTAGLHVFGIDIAKTGQTEIKATDEMSLFLRTTNQPSIVPGAQPIFWEVIVHRFSGRILGASLWGGKGAAAKINVLSMAIRNQMTTKDLAECDYLYSPPFAPMADGFLHLHTIYEKQRG
jgi:NADPH-dependent 2,4-dienoyl-CoA reductase/sulfur reductase-like enzyme